MIPTDTNPPPVELANFPLQRKISGIKIIMQKRTPSWDSEPGIKIVFFSDFVRSHWLVTGEDRQVFIKLNLDSSQWTRGQGRI